MKLLNDIKSEWGWTGIDPAEIVAENDFGNLIIRDEHGKFWRLSPEERSLDVVANTQEALDTLFNDPEFLSDWNMKNLVDMAKDELGLLPQGHKYYLVVPGVLGGEYDLSNIRILDFSELIRVSGSLGEQIKDVPDGAQVKLVVK